jgi:hypothetical protein
MEKWTRQKSYTKRIYYVLISVIVRNLVYLLLHLLNLMCTVSITVCHGYTLGALNPNDAASLAAAGTPQG